MHRLSLVSLAALLVVGGILAFTVFVSPQATAAPAPAQTSSKSTNSQSAGTNSSLLSQPPTSTRSGGDDGSGSDG